MNDFDHRLPDAAQLLYDPTSPLIASGNLPRRTPVGRAASSLVATSAALGAVAILAIVVFGVIQQGAGAGALTLSSRTRAGWLAGGIFNSLVGTLEIVACAALIAVPIGILTGLYLTEFAGPDRGRGDCSRSHST